MRAFDYKFSFKLFGSERTLTRKIHGIASLLSAKMIRPPEGRCSTTKYFKVILKSTALSGPPLNLGVEVEIVLLIYFERRVRRVALDFPRTPNYSTFNDLKNLSSSRRLIEQAIVPSWAVFFF